MEGKRVIVNTREDAVNVMHDLIIKLGEDKNLYEFVVDTDVDLENTYKEKKSLLDRQYRVLGDSHRLLSNIETILEGNAHIEVKKNYLLLLVRAKPIKNFVVELPRTEVTEYMEESFPEPIESVKRELKSFGYKLRYKYKSELEEAYNITKSYLN